MLFFARWSVLVTACLKCYLLVVFFQVADCVVEVLITRYDVVFCTSMLGFVAVFFYCLVSLCWWLFPSSVNFALFFVRGCVLVVLVAR